MNGNFEISKDEVLEILTKTGRYDKAGVGHLLIHKGLASTLSDIMNDLSSLEERVKKYEEAYKKVEDRYFDLLRRMYDEDE
jgi:chaperonin cofactor prefoldin